MLRFARQGLFYGYEHECVRFYYSIINPSGFSGAGGVSGSYFLKIRSKIMQAVKAITENPQTPLSTITRANVFAEYWQRNIIIP